MGRECIFSIVMGSRRPLSRTRSSTAKPVDRSPASVGDIQNLVSEKTRKGSRAMRGNPRFLT